MSSFKLLFGFVALWTFLFTSQSSHKIVSEVPDSPKSADDPEACLVPEEVNENDFLFVDCTGFYE